MKKIVSMLLLLCAISASAQTPYTTLDSLASHIRKIQLRANNASYTADDGKIYKVSFTEDNFGVFSHNRLAYGSVYKELDGKELLQIIENIDLSAATALEVKEAGDVTVVALKFPSGHLKPTLLENGTPATSPDIDKLQFFCKSDNVIDRNVLYSLVAHLTNKMKEEKGLLAAGKADELAQKWASASKAIYPQSLTSYATFLNDNQTSLYSGEAKKILTLERERKQLEDKRLREAKVMQQQIYDLASVGDQSYRNYNAYYRADTTASRLLKLYKTSEIGQANSSRLVSYRTELQERYRWNHEYYEKFDRIRSYDAMVQKTTALDAEFTRKVNASVGGTLFLKASLIALGGIATLVGGYATIAKDNAFSSQLRNNLLMYGGGAFTIGMTWTILESGGIKRAGKRAEAARAEAQQMKQDIGPVLDKRSQNLGGKPLINEN